MLLFTAGLLVGGLFGVVIMCLFQVSQPKEPTPELEAKKGFTE